MSFSNTCDLEVIQSKSKISSSGVIPLDAVDMTRDLQLAIRRDHALPGRADFETQERLCSISIGLSVTERSVQCGFVSISRKVSAKPDGRVDAPSQFGNDFVSGVEDIAEPHRVILVRLVACDVFFFDLLTLGDDLDCAIGEGPHLTRGVF